MMFPRGIAVLGLGYIGLPTSAAIAAQGVLVKGVDINSRTVELINRGEVPIVEPDLDAAVAGAYARGRLQASLEVPEADAFLIAVPTPLTPNNEPDLSFVRAAAESIAPRLRGGEVVILESTSPPGTTKMVSEWIGAARPDLKMPHEAPDNPDIHVAHCPERVLPGRIMIEIAVNDRLVGGLTPLCAKAAAKVYALFCKGEIILTDAATAEMSKLVENAFRDVNIAYANELAEICDSLELDVREVIRLANRHPRVNILSPGPGVGGHCIAVDPWFIVAAAPNRSELIRTARETNNRRPSAVVDKVLTKSPSPDVIVCLGLAFKANIDDLRESPAVAVVAGLAERAPDRIIYVVEPHVRQLPASLSKCGNVRLTPLSDALHICDTLVLLVAHRAFSGIDVLSLPFKTVIDTCGGWSLKS
jgi:UDP-N-acetyl-D-mannosaminuronic acid dehydrogenase